MKCPFPKSLENVKLADIVTFPSNISCKVIKYSSTSSTVLKMFEESWEGDEAVEWNTLITSHRITLCCIL